MPLSLALLRRMISPRVALQYGKIGLLKSHISLLRMAFAILS